MWFRMLRLGPVAPGVQGGPAGGPLHLGLGLGLLLLVLHLGADLVLDLVAQLRVVLQELAGVVPALGDAHLAVVAWSMTLPSREMPSP